LGRDHRKYRYCDITLLGYRDRHPCPAILVKFPISKVFVALKAAFTADTIDAPSLVEVTISLAKKSRKGGLLAQEGQHR
jgi:flagellar motor component MotA